MAKRRQMVVFKVGGEEFALDIMLAKEVLPVGEITPVPEAAAWVEGVMNLRGSLVPVLDFRKRLRAGSSASHEERRIIVARFDERLVGLIVDGVLEVVRIFEEQIEQAPEVLREAGVNYISGIINLNGRYLTMIDLEQVLTGEVAVELEEVMRLIGRGRLAEAPAEGAGLGGI